MTTVGDDQEAAFSVINGLSNQFDITINDMVPYLQSGPTKPDKVRTLNTLISYYNLDIIDAVVAVNPSDVVSFIRSLISHYKVDILHLVEGGSSELVRLMRASDLHITDVVDPLRSDLSDLCSVAERMALRWEQSDPRARAQAAAAAATLAKKEKAKKEKAEQEEKTGKRNNTTTSLLSTSDEATNPFNQREALRSRMKHEIVYLLQHFGIDIFGLLDLYSFGAEEITRVIKQSGVAIADICHASGYDAKSVMPLLRDMISKFSVNPEEVLTLANPARLTIGHVFRHFRVDATTAVGTLQQLYGTTLADIMPLYNKTDEDDVANLVARFQSNLPALVERLSPQKEEAVATIRSLIKTSRLGVADVAKVLKYFALDIPDLMTHFRVTITDVLAVLKGIKVPLEELVDIMLHGQNRSGCISFINHLIFQHNISIMEIQSQHQQSLASMVGVISDLIQLHSIHDITSALNAMHMNQATTLNDLARSTYVIGIMAAIARFKHPNYLDVVFKNLTDELPISLDKMLRTVQFSFPTQDTECQTITYTTPVAVQATVSVKHEEIQFDVETTHRAVQATVHATRRAIQTDQAELKETAMQYLYADITEEVATQTHIPTNTTYTDPMEIPIVHQPIQCTRLAVPCVPRGTQATMLLSHASVQATVQQVHRSSEAIASTNDVECTAFPRMNDVALQVWHPAPRKDVLMQTQVVATVGMSCQTQRVFHKNSAQQCDSVTSFSVEMQTDPRNVQDVAVMAPRPRTNNSSTWYRASDTPVGIQVEPERRTIGVMCLRVSRQDLVQNDFVPTRMGLFHRPTPTTTTTTPGSPPLRGGGGGTKAGGGKVDGLSLEIPSASDGAETTSSDSEELPSRAANFAQAALTPTSSGSSALVGGNNNRRRRMPFGGGGGSSAASSPTTSPHTLPDKPNKTFEHKKVQVHLGGGGGLVGKAGGGGGGSSGVEVEGVEASCQTTIPLSFLSQRQCLVSAKMDLIPITTTNTAPPGSGGGDQKATTDQTTPVLTLTRQTYQGPDLFTQMDDDSSEPKKNEGDIEEVLGVTQDQLDYLENRLGTLSTTLLANNPPPNNNRNHSFSSGPGGHDDSSSEGFGEDGSDTENQKNGSSSAAGKPVTVVGEMEAAKKKEIATQEFWKLLENKTLLNLVIQLQQALGSGGSGSSSSFATPTLSGHNRFKRLSTSSTTPTPTLSMTPSPGAADLAATDPLSFSTTTADRMGMDDSGLGTSQLDLSLRSTLSTPNTQQSSPWGGGGSTPPLQLGSLNPAHGLGMHRRRNTQADAPEKLNTSMQKNLVSRLHPSGPSDLWKPPRTDLYASNLTKMN